MNKRVKYNRCPLVEVIFQLRFPTILSINSKQPADFQEKIRKEYPFYDEGIEEQNELLINTNGKSTQVKSSQNKNYKFDRNPRSDDYCELSINWNDDEGALLTLLSQRKPFKDELQFKIGYCSIQKSMMRELFRPYMADENFAYERRPIQKDEENDIAENPYHGNLLLKKDASKALKKNIQCGLATLAAGSLKKREE